MKKNILFFGLILIVLSCVNKKKQEKEPFIMYETSELSKMMEEMYVFNDSIKQQIINKESLSSLPFDLEQLHKAEMTNRFERDDNFNKFAEVFKNYQLQLYSTSKDSLKTVYNNTINTCIACHQNSCTGPIPRIKKLLIQ